LLLFIPAKQTMVADGHRQLVHTIHP
jgi:hypothetical protein